MAVGSYAFIYYIISILFPCECEHSVDVDEDYCCRSYILKYRLHPWLYLETLSCVGFSYEIIPAPSKLVAAEKRKYKRTNRKYIVGNYEIPEIQPCSAFSKRLEMEHTES